MQAAAPAATGERGGAADVGLGERIAPAVEALRLPGFAETVRGVVTSVRQALDEHRPDSLSAEFGIEIAARAGALLSVLAEVGGTAQVKVTASWDRIASTPRYLDKSTNEWKDGDCLFLTCNVWRQAAENVAESLTRGMLVIVSGRLRQRSYEAKEGEERTVHEVDVDDVGPSLRNASAKVVKVSRSRTDSGTARASSTSTKADPWPSEGPGGYSGEPPF